MEIMTEIMKSNLATGQDLKDMRFAMQSDIVAVQTELKADINDLRHEIKQSEYRMTIKLGTIVSLALGVAVAVAKLI